MVCWQEPLAHLESLAVLAGNSSGGNRPSEDQGGQGYKAGTCSEKIQVALRRWRGWQYTTLGQKQSQFMLAMIKSVFAAVTDVNVALMYTLTPCHALLACPQHLHLAVLSCEVQLYNNP